MKEKIPKLSFDNLIRKEGFYIDIEFLGKCEEIKSEDNPKIPETTL